MKVGLDRHYTPVKNLQQKHRYSHWDRVDICFRC